MISEIDNKEIYNINDLIKSYIKKTDNKDSTFNQVLIEWLIDRSFFKDNEITNSNITFTNSLNKILKLFLDEFTKEGDTIIIGKPYDKAIIDIIKECNLDIIYVNIDNEGIDLMEVNSILQKKINRTNSNVILYLMPYFNEPCNRLLSNGRKELLNSICNDNSNLWVISNETLRLSFWDTSIYNNDNCKSLSLLNDRIFSIGCIDDQISLYWLYNRNSSLIDDINFEKMCNLSIIEEIVFIQLFNDKKLIDNLNKKYSNYKKKYDIIEKRLNDFNIKFNKRIGGNNYINISFDLKIPISKINEKYFKDDDFKSFVFYKEGYDYNFNFIQIDFVNNTDTIIIRELNKLRNIIKMIKCLCIGIYTDNKDFLYNISDVIVSSDSLYHYQTIHDDYKINKLMEMIVCNASVEKTNLLIDNLIKNNIYLPIVIMNKDGLDNKLLFNYIKNTSISIIDEVYEGKNIISKIKEFVISNYSSWKETDTFLESFNEKISFNHDIYNLNESSYILKHINFLKDKDKGMCFKDFSELNIKLKKEELILQDTSSQMKIYSVYNYKIGVLENMEDKENVWKVFINIFDDTDYIIFIDSEAGIYGDLSYKFTIYDKENKITYFEPIGSLCTAKYLYDKYSIKDDTISCEDFESDFEILETSELVKVSLPDPIVFDSNNFCESLKEKLDNLEMIKIEDIKIYMIGIINIIVELEISPFFIPDESLKLLTEIIIDSYNSSSIDILTSKLNISYMLYEIKSDNDNGISIRTFNESKQEVIYDLISTLCSVEFYKDCYENNIESLNIDISLKDGNNIEIEYSDNTYYTRLLVNEIEIFNNI
jgi:hypothetical protein